jgi:chromosome segregation ATPase
LSETAGGGGTLLSSELRHHVVSDSAMDSDAVPEIVNRLYRLLVNAAAGGGEVDDAEWCSIRASYRQSTQLLNPWLDLSDVLRRDLSSRNIDLEALRQENEQLTRGLRHAEVLVQEREEHVQVLDRALQEAQALVQEREEHVQVLDRALQEAQALVQERNTRIEELDAALQAATRYVRQHETSIMTLTSELEQLKKKRTKAR